MKVNKPVFFDLHKKRWPKVRAGLYFFGLSLSVIFLILIASIVINPVLQSLSLPHSSFLPNGGHIVPNLSEALQKKDRLTQIKKNLKIEIGKEQNVKTFSWSMHASGSTLRMWYFVNWDDASLNSLKTHLPSLDIVVGEWLHLTDGSGNISEDNPERQRMVTDYIRSHKTDTKILALVNNYTFDQWQGDSLAQSLSSSETRQKMVDFTLRYVENAKLDGVSVDFESIPLSSQKDVLEFVKILGTAFHEKHLLVTINLPAGDNNFDYKQYALYPDYVIIMAYDEHWSTSDAGPIASLDWFQNILGKQVAAIPKEKIILALGNYAYDWQDGSKEAQIRTFEEAVLTAKESEGDITMDPVSINPTFDYADDNNTIHHVWMLDATTVFNEMKIAQIYKTHGFALWRLGSEDPSVWSVFGKDTLTKEDTKDLSSIAFKYDVDYEGLWEILRVTEAPQVGSRTIGFDDTTGFIDELNYLKYPSPYVVSRYGAQEKKIALTFDDGPDPLYTPQVLDILKKYKVPGTFFVIGENAEKFPEIVKRAFDEGDDIGNHTFTHPNIEDVSYLQLQLELASTERLIEEITGHKSHLFRPPYSEDTEPDTADQVRPIERINNLGYITVGMQIDPNDWKKPGVQQIVDSAVSLSEKGKGNVMLLHDAGGDRTETIQALPRIIETLQEKGYTFVSVSELLGKKREEVMPPITRNEIFFRFFNNIGFNTIYVFNLLLHFLFVFWILLGLSRLLFIIILAIYQKYKQKGYFPKNLDNLSVAVIVPAYNEEKVINQTIASLLSSYHPKRFEIIVVDDGSTDTTYDTVHSAYGEDNRIQIYKIENSWKPGALNFGIAKTEADIIITLDADTVFAKDTILKLVRHFEDEKVWAVAGNAKVGNRMNLMTRWQALEYIVSQNLDRRAFVMLNCITVVPWAVGAWRTSLVKLSGGFSSDTLAEDADLTIEIGKLGYKILYEEEAIALTEAPDTVRAFTRQRYRWMFGTFQVGWKHRKVLFRPKYGWLGFFALPNIFIYQILFPLVSPVMDLLMVISVVSAIFAKLAHPASFSTDSLKVILFYYAIFLLVDYVASYIAFLLEGKEDKSLLIWLFLQRFFYRQLMYFVAIKSILSSLKWHEVGWNKLERKATVRLER